jgi:MFS transporter, DHA2 family, multidrug resistance protein
MRTAQQSRDRRVDREDSAGSPGPGRDRRWLVLAVLVVSVSVVVLDNTVLTVALPRIQQELGASQSQQEWLIAAYTLVFAALLFPFGVLADRSGRRRVLAGGLALFGLGSLASAYASSAGLLIGWRAVMGMGAAAVLPATLSVITNGFDRRERGRAIAIWAGASGVALAVGPLVGVGCWRWGCGGGRCL